MKTFTKNNPVVITFKTLNGNIWEETHYGNMVDMFINDPTVYEIRNQSNDQIIYKKEGK